MPPRLISVLVLASVALFGGAPVSAQGAASSPATLMDQAAQVRRVVQPQPARRLDWRAYFLVDSNSMVAAETFEAIFGKSHLLATGGGAEVLDVWKGVFARVAFSNMQAEGTRVVVFDDEVVSVGIPLRLKMRPIEIGGGWRLRPVAAGRLVPYVGGGLINVKYTETSDLGDSTENSDTSFLGLNVFGGIEARVAPWIVAGAELQFRSVANALGNGGVSKEFDESNLGGVTLRVMVGVRR